MPLSDKKLALFREMLSELQLIVIDEMSLLKADMLYCIHMRLCEVFQSKDLFANKSIILVGDLLQLPPVKGKFVFERPVTLKFSVFFDVWLIRVFFFKR